MTKQEIIQRVEAIFAAVDKLPETFETRQIQNDLGALHAALMDEQLRAATQRAG